jgi:hypothetical protein
MNKKIILLPVLLLLLVGFASAAVYWESTPEWTADNTSIPGFTETAGLDWNIDAPQATITHLAARSGFERVETVEYIFFQLENTITVDDQGYFVYRSSGTDRIIAYFGTDNTIRFQNGTGTQDVPYNWDSVVRIQTNNGSSAYMVLVDSIEYGPYSWNADAGPIGTTAFNSGAGTTAMNVSYFCTDDDGVSCLVGPSPAGGGVDLGVVDLTGGQNLQDIYFTVNDDYDFYAATSPYNFNVTYEWANNLEDEIVSWGGITYDYNGPDNSTAAYVYDDCIATFDDDNTAYQQDLMQDGFTYSFWYYYENNPLVLADGYLGFSGANEQTFVKFTRYSNNNIFRISNTTASDALTIPWDTQDVWHHLAVTYAQDTDLLVAYYDGVHQGNQTMAVDLYTNIADEFHIGCIAGSVNTIAGSMDQFKIYNRSLTESEVIEDYNFGNPANDNLVMYLPFSLPGNSTIKASSTENGGYIEQTLNGFYPNETIIFSLYQAVLNLIPTEIFTNNTITSGFFSTGDVEVAEGSSLYLGAGDHNISFSHPDYFNITTLFNVVALSDATQYFTNVYDAYVDITAYNGITNSSISTFAVSTNNGDDYATTDGNIFIPWLEDLNLSLSFSSFGYASTDVNHTFTPNATSLNQSLYTENSVLISIYDETTGNPIAQNTSIRVTSDFSESEVFTEGSYIYFFDDLEPSEYQFYFNTSGYSHRIYTITVEDGSTQDLSVYLTTSTSTTIFTVFDADEISTTIENVYASMYRLFNETWMPVESKLTDVVGTAQFTYDPTANYKFIFAKSGYDNNIFYLNPILYDSYNIQLTQTTLINYTADFDDLIILYAPGQFDNGTLTDFQFLFSSPEGELLNYGFNLSHPGGETILSGTNALGSQLGANVTVEADTVFDFVILTYYYETVLSGQREFIALLPINFASESGAGNFATQQDETYGLGIFERVFIITLVLLFVVGIAALVGMPIEGLLLAMLIGGYMSYIGFIDLWIILPSLLLGFFYVIWKTGE